MMKTYKVALREYERGWGSRLDEVRSFDTLQEAETFVREFNSKNDHEHAPDWFMTATLLEND